MAYKLMANCSSCGLEIPDDQGSSCSMCYGDIAHGHDGYYEEWAKQEIERSEESEEEYFEHEEQPKFVPAEISLTLKYVFSSQEEYDKFYEEHIAPRWVENLKPTITSMSGADLFKKLDKIEAIVIQAYDDYHVDTYIEKIANIFDEA